MSPNFNLTGRRLFLATFASFSRLEGMGEATWLERGESLTTPKPCSQGYFLLHLLCLNLRLLLRY